MSNSSEKRSAAKGSTAQSSQEKQTPVFVGRYVSIDSHLIERNGSTPEVFGIAGERPAGRKLAKDIAGLCNQLYTEDYDVFTILPLTGGRIAGAGVEAEEEVEGRTYKKEQLAESQSTQNVTPQDMYTDPFRAIELFRTTPLDNPSKRDTSTDKEVEEEYFVDTGVGYSVTDGVVVIAKRRNA